MAKLNESRTESFNVPGELVRKGVEFADAADRLQKFLSREFYSRASDFDMESAKALISECKDLIGQIERAVAVKPELTMTDFRREFVNILSGIRGGRINVDYPMMAGAKKIFYKLMDNSERFAAIVDYLDDEFFDDFHDDDNREAVTALILALKRLKVIK